MWGDEQQRDKYRGCLIGLAVGDAIGTTVEFKPRGSFEEVTDMVGGGPFELNPGEWTDDTSMALCLAFSLITREGFDAEDQMKNYSNWYRNGFLSSNGLCFDIGNTTRRAITDFEFTGEPFCGPTEPFSAGNGCIMRLAPIPMYYAVNLHDVVRYSGESSRTTHGASESIEASMLFGWMLAHTLRGFGKMQSLFSYTHPTLKEQKIKDIADGTYVDKTILQVSGSGYVVESLEAALWCFYHTESFADAVLMAVNLGDDADTTAAITGQIAGAYYGIDGIPEKWVEKVKFSEGIIEFADKLFDLSRYSYAPYVPVTRGVYRHDADGITELYSMNGMGDDANEG